MMDISVDDVPFFCERAYLLCNRDVLTQEDLKKLEQRLVRLSELVSAVSENSVAAFRYYSEDTGMFPVSNDGFDLAEEMSIRAADTIELIESVSRYISGTREEIQDLQKSLASSSDTEDDHVDGTGF